MAEAIHSLSIALCVYSSFEKEGAPP